MAASSKGGVLLPRQLCAAGESPARLLINRTPFRCLTLYLQNLLCPTNKREKKINTARQGELPLPCHTAPSITPLRPSLLQTALETTP